MATRNESLAVLFCFEVQFVVVGMFMCFIHIHFHNKVVKKLISQISLRLDSETQA